MNRCQLVLISFVGFSHSIQNFEWFYLLVGYISVTKCKRAEVALSLLRENKNGFDIVLSDVHMPDMDGFKLLERIGLEMDLPVISKHPFDLFSSIDRLHWYRYWHIVCDIYSDVRRWWETCCNEGCEAWCLWLPNQTRAHRGFEEYMAACGSEEKEWGERSGAIR